MKKATGQKIAKALQERLEEIFGRFSISGLPDAQQAMYAEVEKVLKGKVDDATLQSAMRAGVMAGVWEEMEQGLKDRPEPTPEQLEKILKEIWEADIASMLRISVKNFLRTLRRGKNLRLTPEQQKEVFTQLRQLTAKGSLSHKKAYAQVAQKYGVHWRTIQNLWVKTHKGVSKGDTK